MDRVKSDRFRGSHGGKFKAADTATRSLCWWTGRNVFCVTENGVLTGVLGGTAKSFHRQRLIADGATVCRYRFPGDSVESFAPSSFRDGALKLLPERDRMMTPWIGSLRV
jgi:hypothetical protein